MPRKTNALALALLAATLLAGCSSTSVKRISDEKFAPNPRPESVRMFVGTVTQPHVEIAYVNSFKDADDTVVVKRRQLEDLRARSAQLGADAVIDVRSLRERHRGFTLDPTTPFTSWRQGRYETHFLRGVAVRFVEPGESETEWEELQAGTQATETLEPGDLDPETIPVQSTSEEAPARPTTPHHEGY